MTKNIYRTKKNIANAKGWVSGSQNKNIPFKNIKIERIELKKTKKSDIENYEVLDIHITWSHKHGLKQYKPKILKIPFRNWLSAEEIINKEYKYKEGRQW